MKKIIFIFAILVFIISACASAKTEVVASATPTVSPTITYTSTPNITPLPTIPTFTPTFDVSTIITVTPAEKAECPKVDYAIQFDNGFEKIDACMKLAATANKDPFSCLNKNLHNEILDYLNSGGDINKIFTQLDTKDFGENYLYVYKDITGDTEPEFLLRDTFRHSSTGGYFFYICVDRNFVIKREAYQDTGIEIHSIQDINLNGIPETIFIIQNVLVVVEWDGNSFVETLGIRDFGESQFQIYDTNNDGLQEIILSRGYPPFWGESEETPWRRYTSIYSWNSSLYVLKSKEFEYPQYRFQAIQDADKYTENGINGKALSYYQDAIFNKNLEWWSQERREYLASYLHMLTPTPSSEDPIPNPAEYPSLASYAYYRVMLLEFAQSQIEEANTTYQTLLDTFGNDMYAKPYIEMATAFLEAYQVNQSMYDGCAAAIQYAVEHPEILIPLGSDYHGSQSKIYKPEDVCPFR